MQLENQQLRLQPSALHDAVTADEQRTGDAGDAGGAAADDDVPSSDDLSQLLISCGFAALAPPPGLLGGDGGTSNGAGGTGSTDPALRRALLAVLLQYRQRASLLSQLLAERRDAQRGASRGAGDFARAEQERDAAVREAERAKAELLGFASREGARLEAKYREVEAKLSSEVSRLKFALKEAEAALAAARAGAAGAGNASDAAAQQVREAQRVAQRCREDAERMASEVARQKAIVGELDKAAAAARADAKRSADREQQALRDLVSLRQLREEDVSGLSGEAGRARARLREAEQEAAALRGQLQAHAEAAAAELSRALSAAQASHQEEVGRLVSELQRYRQQVSELQVSEATARSAAKAESSAAAASDRQLSQLQKQQAAEAARLAAEAGRLRETVRQLEEEALPRSRLLDSLTAELAAAEAAAGRERAAAEAAGQDAEQLREASRKQAALLGDEAAGLRRQAAELQQQLASSEAELRRLRAAAGLAEAAPAAGARQAGAGAGVGTPPPALRHVSAAAATAATSHAAPEAAGGAGAADLAPAAPAAGESEGCDTAGLNAVSVAANLAAESATEAAAATASATAAAASVGHDADLAAAFARALRAEVALADAESLVVQLRYRVSLLDHSLKAKEAEGAKLRERLADKVAKEERRLARDKAAYARLRQAHAATKRDAAVTGAMGARGAAGAVAAAAREMRPVEIVGVFEAQREALEAELAVVKQEARVLASHLRDAQNLAMTKDRQLQDAARRAAAPGGREGGVMALREQRRAAELQRELCSVRADAAEALRLASRRAAEAEQRAVALLGDVEALTAELQGRPSVQDIRRLKREVDLLERKLAHVKRRAAGGEGAAAEDGEELLAALADKAGFRGVRSRVERDKAVARLGLGVVAEVPRELLVDTVQDACILLGLRDPTLLEPTLKKGVAVLKAVPSMEAFVAEVCGVVFRSGLPFCPPAALSQGISPGAAPGVLAAWLRALRQWEALRGLLVRVRAMLQERLDDAPGGGVGLVTIGAAGGAGAGGLHGDLVPGEEEAEQLLAGGRQLLEAVEQLVVSETGALAAQEVLQAAEGLMASRPEGLLQRMVAHAQTLLDVPDLEGVLPSLNRLYVSHQELSNLFRSLASLLALPGDAGPGAAVAAIRRLVEAAGRDGGRWKHYTGELAEAAAGGAAAEGDLPAAAKAAAAPRAALNREDAHGARGDQSAAGGGDGDGGGDDGASAGRAGGAASGQLQALLASLGAPDTTAAVERHKRLIDRLSRLDALLPRYQRLAAQLFEALRVTSLDEVMPALTALAQQQAGAAAAAPPRRAR